MSLRSDMMKELKTNRDLIYEKERKVSNYATSLDEKTRADLEYLAMMQDIDLDDEDGDNDE